MPESDQAAELCLFCNLHPADPKAKPVEESKTQRMRRCVQCQEHLERINVAALQWGLLVGGSSIGVLALAGLIAYLVWGAGEYLVAFLILAMIGGSIGYVVAFIMALNQAWSEIPYEMKTQGEVQAELDEKLTLADLMAVAVPDQQFSFVAVGRWQNLGTRVGSLVATAVFGSLLAGTKYRVGLVGISGQKLYLIDFGMIVGEQLTVSKLDYAAGTPQTESADLVKLTGSVTSTDDDVCLSLDGDLSYYIVFPKSFSADNEANALKIHEALEKQTA